MAQLPPLGIQSYCFRNFPTLDALIGQLQGAGLSRVEIYPGHISHGAEDRAEKVKQLEAAGIKMSSYGIVGFNEDEGNTRAILEFAKQAGFRTVGADMPPAAYGSVEKLLEEYDLRIGIHNHGRNHHYGSLEQMTTLLERTGERVGLCLDTAWALDAGVDPLVALERFGPRIYGVHVKDFVFHDGRPEDVIVGTGGLKLPEFMKGLAEFGVVDYVSLEYEGDADNPLPAVKECVAAVKAALEATGVQAG